MYMYNSTKLKFLKEFILENSYLEKRIKITLLNLQNLVVSFNQIIKTISFVKSERREIYIYISDPYVLYFYQEVFLFLKDEIDLAHVRLGNKKDLFSRLKTKKHNIGLIFYLNTAENILIDKIEKYALSQNIFFFSGILSRSNLSSLSHSNRFLFPVQITNIKNNILFALFLVLI